MSGESKDSTTPPAAAAKSERFGNRMVTVNRKAFELAPDGRVYRLFRGSREHDAGIVDLVHRVGRQADAEEAKAAAEAAAAKAKATAAAEHPAAQRAAARRRPPRKKPDVEPAA